MGVKEVSTTSGQAQVPALWLEVMIPEQSLLRKERRRGCINAAQLEGVRRRLKIAKQPGGGSHQTTWSLEVPTDGTRG